jgi:uncharacterized DUF497 family protein
MKRFKWNSDKNQKLINERGLSFEIIVYYIEKGKILDDIEHPNKETYGRAHSLFHC